MMVWKIIFSKRVFSGSMLTFRGVFLFLGIYLLFSFASFSLSSLGGVVSSTRIPLGWTVGLDGLNKNIAMSHDRRTCFIILFLGFSRFLETCIWPNFVRFLPLWCIDTPTLVLWFHILVGTSHQVGRDDTFRCGILLVLPTRTEDGSQLFHWNLLHWWNKMDGCGM